MNIKPIKLETEKRAKLSDAARQKVDQLVVRAVMMDNVDLLLLRIAQGAHLGAEGNDKNESLLGSGRNDEDESLLETAVIHGSEKVISFLIDHGESLGYFIEGREGRALLRALQIRGSDAGAVRIAKLLACWCDATAVNIQGQDALMKICGSTVLDMDMFWELAKKSDLLRFDNSGNDALRVAMTQGHTKAVDFLIGVSDLNRKDKDGCSALGHAVRMGNILAAESILELTSPSRIISKEQQGDMLCRAVCSNSEEMLAWAIKLCDPMRPRADGLSAWLVAAELAGRVDMLAMLAPRSDTSGLDHVGCDALMRSIEGHGHEEQALNLVSYADVLLQDELGESALDKAKRRGWTQVERAIEARLLALREMAEMSSEVSLGCQGRGRASRV